MALPIKQQENKPTPEKPNAVLKFPTPVKVKNPSAVALGRLGGSKGGKVRAKNLSPEERAAIASLAAKARWAKQKGQSV
ncbi:hypothetical protein SBA6_390007 [Candidatus Sulfopaludibacter sp. SbA6]|nr:hypothetical protein SBA6_390007 [Candidatus Sulfopaludibacter sp. SbA6]